MEPLLELQLESKGELAGLGLKGPSLEWTELVEDLESDGSVSLSFMDCLGGGMGRGGVTLSVRREGIEEDVEDLDYLLE